MTYVGAVPTTGDFKLLDSITTSSTTTFNLRQGGVAVYPQSNFHCLVVLNGILQTGGSSFNIVNDTIVFASSLSSDDVINQILVLGNVNDIGVPSSDTVDESKLKVSNSPTNGYMLTAQSAAAGGLTWAAQPSGFDVSSITGATALATQPAATDEIVLSDNGTLKRLDIKHISNTPLFEYQLSGNQGLNHNTATKILWDQAPIDSDSLLGSSKFTPGIEGYYIIHALLPFDELSDGKTAYCMIYKNGSHHFSSTNMTGAATRMAVPHISAMVYLDSDDYIEIYGQHDHGSSRNVIGNSSTEAFFSGFRLTGA